MRLLPHSRREPRLHVQPIFNLKGVRAMKITDAASILGLNGDITPEQVKTAFRLTAKKYHPDINPAGAEMMKVVNAAFETLKDYTGRVEAEQNESTYPEALNNALMAIIALSGIHIEICGVWVWVTGDTYTHKAILKENGFRFASKKKAWHFRPENWKSRSRGQTSLDEIRNKYGSITPAMQGRNQLTCRGAS